MVRLKAYIKMLVLDVLADVKLWLPVRRSRGAWQITGYFECSHGKNTSRQGLTKSLRRAWHIVGVVLLCCGIYNTAPAQDFHVSGVLEGERIFEQKVTGHIHSTQFDVFVSGCNWLIRIDPGVVRGYLEAGYDGDVIRVVAAGFRGRPSAAVVDLEAPLVGGDPRMGILWIAFAQSCYLKKTTPSGYLIPAFIQSLYRKPVPAIVEGLTESQIFPSRVVYFATGTNIQVNGDLIPRRSPFENGFTNGIYSVLNFTNVGGFRIPAEFEFSEFQPSAVRPASSNDISIFLHCIGKISVAEATCTITNFSPALLRDQLSLINDGRFLTPDRGHYDMNYETNRWLTRSEARALPSFQSYIRQEAIMAKIGNPLPTEDKVNHSQRSGRSVPLLIFVGLSTTAALVIFLRRPRNNKTNTTNKP